MPDHKRSTTDWLSPVFAQSGLNRLIETVRSQIILVLSVLGVCVGAAAIYLLVTDEVYEADASMLVSPVPAQDPLLASLGLIRESSDPTLDVQTAAQLITTHEVAVEAAKILGTDRDPSSLLSDVRAEPVGQSNIVAIIARGESPEAARDLANAFGKAVLEVRTKTLHERVDSVLDSLREHFRTLEDSGVVDEALADQMIQLESLRVGPDPTIRLEAPASLPESPVSPRPVLTLVAAIVLGLILGVGAAALLRNLDPRLRREEQLRELFALPILARIPRDRNARRGEPLKPDRVSPATIEAFRTLRVTLAAARGGGGPRSLLITSASPDEGKTSAAVNLAFALARTGRSVILIEADLRRPTFENVFRLSAPHGVHDVLAGDVSLNDALVTVAGQDNLALLMAGPRNRDATELFGLAAGERLIAEAEALADYVIVDSAPLTAVIDSMPLAGWVDGVLIVVRYGSTHLGRLRELGELMAANDVIPVGIAVQGVRTQQRSAFQDYYVSAKELSGAYEQGVPREDAVG